MIVRGRYRCRNRWKPPRYPQDLTQIVAWVCLDVVLREGASELDERTRDYLSVRSGAKREWENGWE